MLGESKAVVRERLQNGQPTYWRNPTEKHGKLVWAVHAERRERTTHRGCFIGAGSSNGAQGTLRAIQ